MKSMMRMIRMTPQELKRRAENFLRELRPELPLDEVEIEITDALRSRRGSRRRNRCVESDSNRQRPLFRDELEHRFAAAAGVR